MTAFEKDNRCPFAEAAVIDGPAAGWGVSGWYRSLENDVEAYANAIVTFGVGIIVSDSSKKVSPSSQHDLPVRGSSLADCF